MAEYTVTKVEQTTTSTGKPMYKATLMAPDGTPETINLFDPIVEGAKLNGEIYTNEKGYRNFKSAQSVAGGAFKAKQIEDTLNKKGEMIATAQSNKENGIKIASTLNKAVEIAIVEYANPNNLYTIDELIEKWRRYLWLEWDNVNDYPPFK